MDILASEVITQTPWWTFVLVIGVLLGFTFSAVSASRDFIAVAWAMAVLACDCAVAILVLPHNVPSGKIKYTVEITGPEKYKELIDRGYNLDKLYETRDIYEMSGEPIDGSGQ